MPEPHSETIETPQPSEVVAEAMMKAYWDLMKGVEKTFNERSKRECKSMSISTIKYIAKSHPELFKQLLVVTSYVVSPDSWIIDGGEADFINNPPWHSYFLVQDINGYWYAASPANDRPNEDVSPEDKRLNKNLTYATTVFRDKSLDAVIKQMNARDNIQFPTADFIESSLDKLETPFKVVGGRKLEYREVVRTIQNGTYFSPEEVSF